MRGFSERLLRGSGALAPESFKIGDILCGLAHVGGNWNNGTNAGPVYWNFNNTSSDANVNIGTQTLVSRFLKT